MFFVSEREIETTHIYRYMRRKDKEKYCQKNYKRSINLISTHMNLLCIKRSKNFLVTPDKSTKRKQCKHRVKCLPNIKESSAASDNEKLLCTFIFFVCVTHEWKIYCFIISINIERFQNEL
jgi:hypothetical protein